jgi:hypothetical protein
MIRMMREFDQEYCSSHYVLVVLVGDILASGPDSTRSLHHNPQVYSLTYRLERL